MEVTQYILGDEMTASFKRVDECYWAMKFLGNPLKQKRNSPTIQHNEEKRFLVDMAFLCLSKKSFNDYFDSYYLNYMIWTIFGKHRDLYQWSEWLRVKTGILKHQIHDQSLINKLAILVSLEDKKDGTRT